MQAVLRIINYEAVSSKQFNVILTDSLTNLFCSNMLDSHLECYHKHFKYWFIHIEQTT